VGSTELSFSAPAQSDALLNNFSTEAVDFIFNDTSNTASVSSSRGDAAIDFVEIHHIEYPFPILTTFKKSGASGPPQVG
jgi:hypothetical protein